MEARKVVVGSRKSELALIQTRKVVAWLKELHPELTFEIETMETIGDKIQSVALSKIGEKSLFTKELEVALENKSIDFVVHSLKDLPSDLPEGMAIGAICKRDNAYDCVLFHPKFDSKMTLETLPSGSVIGTSSVRRIAQLKRGYPHLTFKDIRGNLNTRLKKLEEADTYDAIILAKAGIDRMGWEDKVGHVFTGKECLYAVGQGAMCVEIRENDELTLKLVDEVNDKITSYRCHAERALMRILEGGCSAPLAVESSFDSNGKTLTLQAACLSTDGKERIEATKSLEVETIETSEQLGKEVAQEMLNLGARRVLDEAHALNKANINQRPT